MCSSSSLECTTFEPIGDGDAELSVVLAPVAHDVEEGIALAETAACNLEVCDDIGFFKSWDIIVHL